MKIHTLGVLAAAGFLAGVSSLAHASAFTDVTLGAAGPGGFNFTAFQTGPTQFSASNSGTSFSGNVGIAAGGHTNFSGGGTIGGTLFVDSTPPGVTLNGGVPGSQMHVTGGVSTVNLTQAVADVKLANTTAASLTPDETFASLGGSLFTITPIGAANGFGGHNTVVHVTGSITITNPSKDLTISGGANDFYIINVGGDVTVSNGQILLTGGITPSNVLFNFTGAGSSVNLSNAISTLNGIFLAPLSGQSINLTPGTVNGAIISDMIHTSSGPDIIGSPPSPEPASLGVLALGAIGLLIRRRRA